MVFVHNLSPKKISSDPERTICVDRRNDETAARREKRVAGAQKQTWVFEVLDNLARKDDIKRLITEVSKGDRLYVAFNARPQAVFKKKLDAIGVHVETNDIASSLFELLMQKFMAPEPFGGEWPIRAAQM